MSPRASSSVGRGRAPGYCIPSFSPLRHITVKTNTAVNGGVGSQRGRGGYGKSGSLRGSQQLISDTASEQNPRPGVGGEMDTGDLTPNCDPRRDPPIGGGANWNKTSEHIRDRIHLGRVPGRVGRVSGDRDDGPQTGTDLRGARSRVFALLTKDEPTGFRLGHLEQRPKLGRIFSHGDEAVGPYEINEICMGLDHDTPPYHRIPIPSVDQLKPVKLVPRLHRSRGRGEVNHKCLGQDRGSGAQSDK
jgi:hypothetical protein